MSIKVIKRDGRFVSFDIERIANAIFKAAKAVGGEDRQLAANLTQKISSIILDKYSTIGSVTVEDIQDIVEKTLIENGHAKTAKAYILYRKQRADARELRQAFGEIENILDEYLSGSDWRIKENSNTTFSLQGLNNFISSSITAKYWLNKIYTEQIKNAHVNGDIHIHDLGSLSVYCCGWDLKDLLFRGFGGVYGKVESAPPKHFRTALGQIVNFFYTLQGEAAGAQAFANFDTLLAPFVAFDNLSYEEVKQGIQEFIFNLNVPTRVGFQTPFTNLTFDLTVPDNFKNEAVVYAGEVTSYQYGEFQREVNLINKAFIEVMSKGDAKGRIFTFPIPTYNISKEFDWENSVVTDLMRMTGRYGTPYFANFVNSDMSPEDARSMCCRLRLDNRELRKRGGGLFGANPLTGSIGVVTINLSRIGYLAEDESGYFKRLSHLMDIARQSLYIKRKILEQYTDMGLYPYSKVYLDSIKNHTGQYWKNHFNTIGIIGMHESLYNFLGVGIDCKEGLEYAAKVLNFMNDNLIKFQEEDDMLYNLEATPAEGTSYRLAKLDKKYYPRIFTSGDNKPYYTNSTQLPVDSRLDLFSALEHQNNLQPLYTGGTVFHTFIGESVDDTASLKELVKEIAYSYKIPYFTITPTFSICPIHGYLKGEHHYCPICKEEKTNEILSEIRQLKVGGNK
ncbi:ribonucleoside triphosphate reductase [Deferribacterales bacterium Es71-Z0220]|jgi:ribonucleoside-triphosphate reductase|nr:ribonucleoside triphosphate reductase [Deferrivibrio essentukiensis]MBZ4672216.1 anaerobic ribonucleoside-triphosphate reductase [Deferribacteraceae bacterium]MCB4203655.1 ribonucleoside triphosphate reductase [Deferrivibrio essentukiensis]